MGTRITQISYENLIAVSATAWVESDRPWESKGETSRFFTNKKLLTPEQILLVEEVSPFKIYRYTDGFEDPFAKPNSIIFPDSLSKHLPKKPTYSLGEKVGSTYYDRYEASNYVEPIVNIDYVYNRDSSGLLVTKDRTISWYLENGELSLQTQQDSIPYTELSTQLKEIAQRRDNVINELKTLATLYSTPQLNLAEKIPEILRTYQIEKSAYVDGGSPSFGIAIESDTSPWLDEVILATGNTSRQIFASYLNIGLSQAGVSI